MHGRTGEGCFLGGKSYQERAGGVVGRAHPQKRIHYFPVIGAKIECVMRAGYF